MILDNINMSIYGWILRQVIAILLMMESTSIYGRKA